MTRQPTQYHQNHHQTHLSHNVFLAFLLTLLPNFVNKFSPKDSDGYEIRYDVFIFLDLKIAPSTCVWIVVINNYLAVLFHGWYKSLNRPEYLLISGWYYFAILEMFLFYNHAWFYVDFGFDKLPMYSDTMIALTFVSSFVKEKINGGSRLSYQLH